MGYYKKYKEEYYTWKKRIIKSITTMIRSIMIATKSIMIMIKNITMITIIITTKSIMMTMIIIMILLNRIKNITKSFKDLFISPVTYWGFFMIFVDDTQIFL